MNLFNKKGKIKWSKGEIGTSSESGTTFEVLGIPEFPHQFPKSSSQQETWITAGFGDMGVVLSAQEVVANRLHVCQSLTEAHQRF